MSLLDISSWPQWWANLISIGLFVLLLLALWQVPRAWNYVGAPDNQGWRDIRIWATALIAIQIVLYAVFR